jgi:hypothetical protein
MTDLAFGESDVSGESCFEEVEALVSKNNEIILDLEEANMLGICLRLYLQVSDITPII